MYWGVGSKLAQPLIQRKDGQNTNLNGMESISLAIFSCTCATHLLTLARESGVQEISASSPLTSLFHSSM